MDGRGVYIWPGSCIQIVHNKNDLLHGTRLTLYKSGDKYIGTWKSGSRNGTEIITRANGSVTVNEW